MEWVIDIFFNLVSHLPKLISERLYSPERTKKNVEVSISAQDGSVVMWCDKCQSKFNVILGFRNNNPFPIEIDRVEISARLGGASIKAVELFGAKLEKNKKEEFFLEGKLDAASLEQVNQTSGNEPVDLTVKALIKNKYHNIRDFTSYHNRLMCQYPNKKAT